MMNFPVQTFSWVDLPLVLLVLVVEVLLSADNAAALAIIVKKLPEKRRKSALFAGLYSAFFLRALGVIFAAYLIHLFWMQIIGGLYLIYISWKFIFGSKKTSSLSPTSYKKAVIYVELIDLLFAIDSILGAFALITLYYPIDMISSKLWIIYLGGALGLIAVRAMTGSLLKILNKYKRFERIIFFVIGWMGVKLLAAGIFPLNHALDIFFWVGTLFVILIGFLSTKK